MNDFFTERNLTLDLYCSTSDPNTLHPSMEICKTQPKMFIHFLTNIYVNICMWNIGKYVWYLQLKLYVEYVH